MGGGSGDGDGDCDGNRIQYKILRNLQSANSSHSQAS